MDTVSELNQSKRDQMVVNNELVKQVNRLTLQSEGGFPFDPQAIADFEERKDA